MHGTRSGIYEIRNVLNNKVYIGSSVDIPERWNEHKRELSKNNHHSILLQRAWNKYGEENFKFNILEKYSENELLNREQYYLDLHMTYDRNKGYNIAKYASAPMKGRKHSKETIVLLVEGLKNRDESVWLRGEESPNSKLKDEDIPEIKRMIYEGYKICVIADTYGVKPNTITQIKTGARWTHINTIYDDLIIKQPKQKLTKEEIVEIKKLLVDNKLTITEISNKYDITFGMVSAIKNLKSHKEVGSEFNKKLKTRHNVRKLNEEKVIAIKRMLEDEISFVDIASEFKVSEKTIRNIKNNKTWTHVDINKNIKNAI